MIHILLLTSGDEHTHEKVEQGHPKHVLSAGSTRFFYAPQKDFNQSLVCFFNA